MKSDSNHSVCIRTASYQDIDSLLSLLQLLFSIEDYFSFDAKKQRKGLEMMLGNPACLVLAAELSHTIKVKPQEMTIYYDTAEYGKVVGMCSGQLTVSTAEGTNSLLIEDVVVAKDFQGCGIGKSLVTAMAEWADQKGVNRMQLLADQRNKRAISFYASLGWHTTNMICLRKYRTV
ncbi:MAG: GNAT family N-acetyltransferase [Desulfamplus sp.]|nr:GNAT family N-acetyltransferase [Desulfamplus sp.]